VISKLLWEISFTADKIWNVYLKVLYVHFAENTRLEVCININIISELGYIATWAHDATMNSQQNKEWISLYTTEVCLG